MKKKKPQLTKLTVVPFPLCRTLEVLLASGFEPNERLEGLVDDFNGSEELSNYVGFAPIQILAAAAVDVLESKEFLPETLFLGIQGLFSNVADFLVKRGARLSLDQPPNTRLRNSSLNSTNFNDASTGSESFGRELKPLDRSEQMKIQSNKELETMLGGIERLNAAQTMWNAIKSTEIKSNSIVFHTDRNPIEDSVAPGGSDERSCFICWKAFGKLMNRKHRCRIARRHVCDECSSKRVVKDGEEHRISDGQFLFAKAHEARLLSRRGFGSEESNMTKERKEKDQSHQQSALAARLDRLEAEEKANRDSLFGNVLGNMTKAVFGEDPEEETVTAQANSSITGLSDQLNQTRNALVQRGEKLNTLAEKSDKLVSASEVGHIEELKHMLCACIFAALWF